MIVIKFIWNDYIHLNFFYKSFRPVNFPCPNESNEELFWPLRAGCLTFLLWSGCGMLSAKSSFKYAILSLPMLTESDLPLMSRIFTFAFNDLKGVLIRRL